MQISVEVQEAIAAEITRQFRDKPLAHQSAMQELKDVINGKVLIETHMRDTGIPDPGQAVLQFAIWRGTIWLRHDDW